MNLKLDDQYLCEVFELLCSIPFEKATMNDSEPPTKRHPGIEQLIDQIATKGECEKGKKEMPDIPTSFW